MRRRRTLLALSLACVGCLRQNPEFDGAASGTGGAGSTTGATGSAATTGPTTGGGSTTSGGSATGGGFTTGGGATTGGAGLDLGGATTGPGSACPPFLDPARVGAPVVLTALNAPESDIDPWLTADGRTLFFASERGGAGLDLYRAERDGRDAPFGAVIDCADLQMNSSDSESKVTLTQDGLRYVVALFQGSEVTLWSAIRTEVSEPFDTRAPLMVAAQPFAPADAQFFDPHLSDGGERLYAAPGAAGLQHIVHWELLDGQYVAPASDPFVNIHTLDGVVADPTLSGDERTLVFTFGPSDDPEDRDLWYATRTSIEVPFSDPKPLAALNTDDLEGSAHLGHDGCELFFARSPAGQYAYDLYVAPLDG